MDYVADLIGVTVNQISFASVQVISLPIALTFRHLLSPSKTSSTKRHVVGGAVGLCLLFWCFSWSVLHMLGQALGVYAAMAFLPAKYNLRVAFSFAMGYLLYIQIVRYITTLDRETFEISFPMMMSTQKLTSIACSIHDGCETNKESLGSYQKRHALKKCPSLLEFFGFTFFFGGIVAGPTFFFRDYMEFISGENYLCEEHDTMTKGNGETSNGAASFRKDPPSPTTEVVKKVCGALFHLFIYLTAGSRFPTETTWDPEFINSNGFLHRCSYVFVSFWLCQFKFHFVWLISEAIQNAAGLGLRYVNGNPHWDLTKNGDILTILFPISTRVMSENWNITSAKWLRHVSYERAGKYRVVFTFLLSAIWHGIEPGFYFSFLTLAMVVVASSKVRKSVRHHVVGTRWKFWYDILTGVIAVVSIIYCLGGFHMLTLRKSIIFYNYMYWWLHIILAVIIILPLPQNHKPKSS